jgi:hypothetical protein
MNEQSEPAAHVLSGDRVYTITAYPDPESRDFTPEDVQPFINVYTTIEAAQQAIIDTVGEIWSDDPESFVCDPDFDWSEDRPDSDEITCTVDGFGVYRIVRCQLF